MNLDDKRSLSFPFLITVAKVCHSRGITFLVSIHVQTDEKMGRRSLTYRLPELSTEMQSRIRAVLGSVRASVPVRPGNHSER